MPLTILLHGDPRAPQQSRLGAALVKRGHRVVVCDAPGVAAKIREADARGCDELRLPRLVPDAVKRWWARRRARALGVDVVHLNFVRPWHVVWSRMRGGPPFVATAWGNDINDEVFPKKPAHARRIDHVLRHAAALTADSPPLLARARARAGERPGAPAEIVLWGVDVGAFDRERAEPGAARWRERLGVDGSTRVLLSPRQTKPHYHVDRILRAFAASRWATKGVLLVKLHGRPEELPYRRELEGLAATLGVAERVRWVPPCAYDELAGLYASADAAVSALEIDGFPSTFCELLALGVPLVATDLAAYAGALAADRALLVPPADHAALVAALDRLLDEPELGKKLGAAGSRWAREHADWEKCVDAFEAIYERVARTR